MTESYAVADWPRGSIVQFVGDEQAYYADVPGQGAYAVLTCEVSSWC